MNALKLSYKSESKNKDFYGLFTYPIGAKVISFEKDATVGPKQARVEVILDLMDHFVIAERKIKEKPTSQIFVENMKNLQSSREWLHERKKEKFDLCLEVIQTKILPALKEVVNEYDIQGEMNEDLMLIAAHIEHTVFDK